MRTFEEITEDFDRDGFGHYMAGFIDGEGSFVIAHAKQVYTCRFQLKLRDDDAPILFELQERTGLGVVKPEKNYSRSRGPDNGRPQMTWVLSNKSDCAMLVRLLERYPLRAKKSRDFAVWKLAVRERMTKRRYGGWETMEALRNQLVDGRRYVEAEPPVTLADWPARDRALEMFDGAAA